MNLAKHQLHIYNTVGTLLTIIPDNAYASLRYGFRENEAGVLELVLPPTFDMSMLMIDGLIEVYRAYGYSEYSLEGDTAFLIRKPEIGKNEDGSEAIYVTAFSASEILCRRIVAYYAGTSYADKYSDPYDDLMREIVYENYGPGASYAEGYGDAARNLEPWFIVRDDPVAGASYPVSKSMAWREVCRTLQEIVDDVRAQGQYAAFDVVRTAPAHFEFRVFIGARGIDHSSDSSLPVVISEDRYNLLQPHLSFDWTGEKNYIYGTGRGEGEDRVVQEAYDNARINISPFNRREFNRDARQAELAETVMAEAKSELERSRPRKLFTGKIGQTDGCIYGIHWKWGDIVTAEYKGFSFDCHVEAIFVSVDADGTEIVEGYLRSESDV